MPGSDDQYDQVHTYSQDHAGKSKTTKPAVREIGRDGAAVQLYVGQDIDESAIRTPPSNVRFLFFNTSGNLRKKNPDGSVDTIGGGAPTDASYVTTASESALSNETVANKLDDVYGSPVGVGASNLDMEGNDLIDDVRTVYDASTETVGDGNTDANHNTGTLTEIAGAVAGNNTITDLLGQGLEFASGSLQILSSIWDGTNIVADVNNSLVDTDDFDIAGSDAVSSGDFLAWGPSLVGLDNDFSTTSTSYVITNLSIRTIWNDWRPSGAQSAFTANGFLGNSNGDVRLLNSLDAENLFEQTNFTGAFNQGPTNYTPTTTGSVISIRFEIRTNDSGTSTNLNDNSAAQLGVQV